MSDASGHDEFTEPERRGFMVKFLAGAIGAIVGLVPTVLGLLFFLDPLLRKKKATAASADPDGAQKDEEGFINLKIGLDALPADGSPIAIEVSDDKVDAWNKFKNVVVGTAWLSRDENGELKAFNTICPHLGCAIDFRQSKQDFYCPCHTSTFDLTGKRQNAIPPRDMDPLPTKIIDDQIWLKYQNFRAATPERIEV